MGEITYKPIGIIRTPFMEPEGTPIQASAARGVEGKVEIFPAFVDGSKRESTSYHIQELIEGFPENRRFLFLKYGLDRKIIRLYLFFLGATERIFAIISSSLGSCPTCGSLGRRMAQLSSMAKTFLNRGKLFSTLPVAARVTAGQKIISALSGYISMALV